MAIAASYICAVAAIDGIAEEHAGRIELDQHRDGTSIMQVQVEQQRPQRIAYRARVSHQVADGTEVLADEALADKKADVAATGEASDAAKSLPSA